MKVRNTAGKDGMRVGHRGSCRVELVAKMGRLKKVRRNRYVGHQGKEGWAREPGSALRGGVSGCWPSETWGGGCGKVKSRIGRCGVSDRGLLRLEASPPTVSSPPVLTGMACLTYTI